jgi:hypothetical protein
LDPLIKSQLLYQLSYTPVAPERIDARPRREGGGPYSRPPELQHRVYAVFSDGETMTENNRGVEHKTRERNPEERRYAPPRAPHVPPLRQQAGRHENSRNPDQPEFVRVEEAVKLQDAADQRGACRQTGDGGKDRQPTADGVQGDHHDMGPVRLTGPTTRPVHGRL